jgi:hypothetical protein
MEKGSLVTEGLPKCDVTMAMADKTLDWNFFSNV